MNVFAAPSLDIDVPRTDQVFIAGDWREPTTGERIDVVSPSTEETLVSVPRPTVADADAAVAAARQAFDSGLWPRMTPRERTDIVARFCEAMTRAA